MNYNDMYYPVEYPLTRETNYYDQLFEESGDLTLYSGEYYTFHSDIEMSRQQEATLTKTVLSFNYPYCANWKCKKRLYRVYLEVKVPQSIASSVQGSLDRCMEQAKVVIAQILLPFATPATMSGLPGAIPGALAAGTKKFTSCVATNPKIYPHINKIKLSIKTNKNA
ncbi:hypothetical protein DJ95_1456 [Bacillus atrophaeus subsp. globigii]|nr:hypothetical protein [Bacillus atrophaeus]AIK48413.1 hypothetical protein DJ95_1456 [Bacillus atrophaeus subsp. globigii]KFK84535.1 hypothetical protein DK44_2179 [Bacillus atrophaeus]MEC1731579.1 hypothetical protein [Bacillus atrophaeus]WQP44474.1 hypothetical protein U0534_20875 [Bacillus atrophaeus]